jgi:hypothetical protein
MIRLTKALMLSAVLATVGGSAMAAEVEINFGDMAPDGGIAACSHSGTDPGFVCANTQSFTAFGNTFTATGMENPFDVTGGGALTLKPTSAFPGILPPGLSCKWHLLCTPSGDWLDFPPHKLLRAISIIKK